MIHDPAKRHPWQQLLIYCRNRCLLLWLLFLPAGTIRDEFPAAPPSELR